MNKAKNSHEWGWIWNVTVIAVCILTLGSFERASAQEEKRVVRIAKLQIDSAQLENYKAMLKEGMATAVRVEPGVLSLYAVYEKDHPTHVTVFEIYANAAAYEAHLKTVHFKKYKAGTQGMVKSLELIDVSPIALEAKAKQ